MAHSRAMANNVPRSVETASERGLIGSEKQGSVTDLEENRKPMKKTQARFVSTCKYLSASIFPTQLWQIDETEEGEEDGVLCQQHSYHTKVETILKFSMNTNT